MPHINIKIKKNDLIQQSVQNGFLGLTVFFFFFLSLFSGVSVNVQDLAPSCAGALFGNVYILYNSTMNKCFLMIVKMIFIPMSSSIFFLKCMNILFDFVNSFYICICIFHAGVMNTCGAFSGETRIMYLWFIFWNYMSVHTPKTSKHLGKTNYRSLVEGWFHMNHIRLDIQYVNA